MWRDDAYLLDMLLYAREARKIVAGKSWPEFMDDRVLQYASQHLLQVLGEAASKVSVDYRNQHPEIPWLRIIGLRHRIVHDYPRIEMPKIWSILDEQLEPLIRALVPLVPPEKP
jgi:uncharacterized protein with HEPN domain